MPNHGCAHVDKGNGNGRFALPSFFLIGPPRTGTTWLHTVLSERAWLAHPTKETRFFDKHFERGLDWYRAKYRNAPPGQVIGEVAPTYFASNDARERIAHLIPNARIICTLRNPADRVLSLYRLKRAYGWTRWTFEEALKRDPELMNSGQYCVHLMAWRRAFGDTQVMVAVQEDARIDAQLYIDKLVDFIGVPRFRLSPDHLLPVLSSEDLTEPRSYYWTRGANLLAERAKAWNLDVLVATAKKIGMLDLFVGGGTAFPQLSCSTQARLRSLFRPEVDRLEGMLNRDLSVWK